jgi:DNA (cytosine-5)-methyltransferase 3A
MLKINNVLSLFDGASCAQMALNHAGIPFKKYFASEINEDSIAIAMKNYPKTIQLGSVMDIKAKDLPKIDAIFAGSPCTDLSRAGKQLGMATLCGIKVTNLKQYLKLKKEGKEFTESCLFWEFIRLVKELKPKYFFLENTKMNKLWLYLITKELGVEPIMINSSLLSAQNRERYYWTNLPGFVYPKDKGITFDQIVPGAVSCGWRGRKFKKTDKKYTRVLTHRNDGKANCVVTSPSSTNLYEKDGKIQPITVEMAEKLQTWPIGYTNVPGLSKTKRYHAIGNGWTKNVIVHFLKCASKFYKVK